MSGFPSAEDITSFPKLVDIKHDDPYQGEEGFAVYTLVPLSATDVESFLRDTNKDDELTDDYLFLAPEYDFSGKTLESIVTYHANLVVSQRRAAATAAAAGKSSPDAENVQQLQVMDRTLFVVIVHSDYKKHGVLLINTMYENYDNEIAVPAVARCPVLMDPEDENVVNAIGWCVNISIANMDMYDLLEQDDDYTWPSPLPGYTDLRATLLRSAADLKQRAHARYSALPVRTERYMMHRIGPRNNLLLNWMYSIQPDRYYIEIADCEDRVAVMQGFDARRITDTLERQKDVIRKDHPRDCKLKRASKFWMFVFDGEGEEGEEVGIVRVKWDGVTEGKTKEELDAIMPGLEVVCRCSIESALSKMDELAGFGT